jgi:hypothetical protein
MSKFVEIVMPAPSYPPWLFWSSGAVKEVRPGTRDSPPRSNCAPCATALLDREQEVVELNSKVPVRDERNKKQESLEVKV